MIAVLDTRRAQMVRAFRWSAALFTGFLLITHQVLINGPLIEIDKWIHDLEPQVKISAGGKNYRLDFYSPSRQFAIEVDGLRWHNGDSFIKDQHRQRDLENAGIRFHRYAAKEVMNDAQDCYRQAAERANNL